MSGGGFHVHGPHDHHVEHASQHGADGDSFAGRIAVLTAILATLGALFAYEGGATQAAAMMAKNDAAIKKTEAANQWSFYQSKSSKQNLAELGSNLTTGERAAKYAQEIERYKTEKAEIQEKAKALEEEASALDHQSEHQLHLHHRWAQATTVLQVAIAMAAIALLTRKKWLQYAVYVTGVAGLVVGLLALLHI